MLNYICEQNLPTDEKGSDLLKFLKDFLYDKNDILIALIILVLAGALIVWRVDVIMEYPSTLVAEIDVSETTDDTAEHANEDTSSETSSEESGATGSESGGIMTDGILNQEVTVTIPGGSATGAVDALIAAGLFESYDDFVTTCQSSGCTPENIKATTYTFEVGMTKADIAAKVTA